MREKDLSLTLVLLKQYKDMFLINFKFILPTIDYFLCPLKLATCNIVSVKLILCFHTWWCRCCSRWCRVWWCRCPCKRYIYINNLSYSNIKCYYCSASENVQKKQQQFPINESLCWLQDFLIFPARADLLSSNHVSLLASKFNTVIKEDTCTAIQIT